MTLLFSLLASGCQRRELRLYFLSIRRGEATVAVAPDGEVLLIDNGDRRDCADTLAQLHNLNIATIDYQIVSHYHEDHMGCTLDLLKSYGHIGTVIDRGGSYSTAMYARYAEALSSQHRTTATPGMRISVGDGPDAVLIDIVAVNGAMVQGPASSDENTNSIVLTLTYGTFRAVFGGDFPDAGSAITRELGQRVGPVNLYKVHSHCSLWSSGDDWLGIIKPQVGVVSVGRYDYDHPNPNGDCVQRLHDHGVQTYWTGIGNGVRPSDDDIVGDGVAAEVYPGRGLFTVRYATAAAPDVYSIAPMP